MRLIHAAPQARRNGLPHSLIPLTLTGLPLALAAAHAQEAPPELSVPPRSPLVETGSESDHLTGSWGGLRDAWVERGLHLQAGYIAEMIGNLAGGSSQGAVYQGLFEAAVELDLEKLTRAWPQATFRISGLWTHGPSPSAKRIGDLQAVSSIDAADSVRLYEFYLEQGFLDRFSVRIGNQLADREFAINDSSSQFLNASFGWPAFVSLNTLNAGPSFYIPALGVRLGVDLGGGVSFKAAVYDGDTFDDPDGNPKINHSGLHLSLDADQGAFSIYELEWERAGHPNHGLPGSCRLGAWHHSADFSHLYEDDLGGSAVVSGRPARRLSGNYGFYLGAEQMLWRESNPGPHEPPAPQGLSTFVRFGFSPRDRSPAPFAIDGGLHYQGLFPGRDLDSLSIGVAHVELSRNLRRRELDDLNFNATPYDAFSDFETAIELVYSWVLKPWWTLQSGAQWVRHPGGSRALDDAVILELRSSLAF